MEAIFYMSAGAAGVVALIILRLAAKHGLAWVEAKLKAKATAAEADIKAKFASVAAPLETRIASAETAIATLKQKVGI
jgi:hypothetical protein